jgi:drug/metabolite transporter (DMT)-like permease
LVAKGAGARDVEEAAEGTASTKPAAIAVGSCEGPAGEATSMAHKVLKGVAFAVGYICVSASMIFFNKFLMHEDRFPFATFLTTLHMLGSVTFSLILYHAMPSLFPAWATVFGGSKDSIMPPSNSGQRVSGLAGDCVTFDTARIRHLHQALLPFAPLGACGTVALVAGNSAYRYSPVAFLQMVKESHIVFVYALSTIVGLEVPRFRSIITIVFVAIAAVCAVCGADGATFSTRGLLLQLLAGLGGSTQIVLSNRMMVRPGSSKIDPLTMVFCTAPAMLVALTPVNILFWDPRIPERLHKWGHHLMANVLCAFILQVVMAMTIRNLSATGHALASVTKDLFIVFSAAWFLQEHVTWIQTFGFIGSVIGISFYSAMKLFPHLRGE